ncbi:TPA: TauD/TfdA family dioxygenase [Legionella pneumophila]|nr:MULTISPECIES: TauD/TfdA family dioxygenase [Legionella]MCW8394602.1 TauD/TfdA family dioxygenase [Legionella sp. PATHC039]
MRNFMAYHQISYAFLNHQKLPLVIQPQAKLEGNVHVLKQFLEEDNALFKEKLLKYGAIILRGFHVHTAEQFLEVIQSSNLGPNYSYDFCPIPRTRITDNIYTSINIHPSFNLALHNEKSYDQDFPSHIFFNCIHAPDTGGATVLADGNKVWFSLPTFLQKKLQSKGILYRRHYYGTGIQYKMIRSIGKNSGCLTWMERFQTDDKSQVEVMLQQMGTQFQWIQGNGLITEQLLPACRNHPISGKLVWFNQSNHANRYYNGTSDYIKSKITSSFIRFILLHNYFHPYTAFYGDGEHLSKQEADCINSAIQKNTVSTAWQPGDVMIVDNYSCLHGKTPHTGNRLILVGLTKYFD